MADVAAAEAKAATVAVAARETGPSTLFENVTAGSTWQASVFSLRFIRQPEAGQRHPGEAEAEFLQRRAARDRLGQTLGEFIELVVHNFLSFLLWAAFALGCFLLLVHNWPSFLTTGKRGNPYRISLATRPARDGLSQALGEFIELVVLVFAFAFKELFLPLVNTLHVSL